MNSEKQAWNVDDLCDAIRCLRAEWGTEHFAIFLPQSWNHAKTRTAFHFVTKDTIIVFVGTGKMVFRKEFSLSDSNFAKMIA